MKSEIQNEKPSGRKSVLKRWVFKILISLVILESFALIALVAYWRYQRDGSFTARQQQMCYSQIKLSIEDNDPTCPEGLTDLYDDAKNETKCCGDISIILNSLLNKTVLDRYNSKINPEITTYDPKAFDCKKAQQVIDVLRFGLAEERKAVPVDSDYKLFWESKSPYSENSGLRYSEEDGEVHVNETEIYYILLELKLNTSKANGLLDEKIRHRVHLVSESSESTILLEDVISPCVITSYSATEKTSIVGAVFRLKHGDQLYVTTTHPDSIVTDPHNNHFSIHRV